MQSGLMTQSSTAFLLSCMLHQAVLQSSMQRGEATVSSELAWPMQVPTAESHGCRCQEAECGV